MEGKQNPKEEEEKEEKEQKERNYKEKIKIKEFILSSENAQEFQDHSKKILNAMYYLCLH